ncbi:MAG: hypothetical protein PHG79_02710 [Methanosarcina sp.]|nr:hypothetical protein [Methanosarcina sp.]MDD3872684.1 hypothetical protein [Methanosarcina sp.]MDD4521902.1 hypothetical protein [Methanosarcina sp.]
MIFTNSIFIANLYGRLVEQRHTLGYTLDLKTQSRGLSAVESG